MPNFPTPGQTEHRCPRCARLGRNPYHPVDQFPTRRDGSFRGWCRTCDREHRAEYSARRRGQIGAPSVIENATGPRQFGCEIEFIGDRHRVESELQARGINARNESYNHRVSAHWKIVPDASVFNGAELVSPPLSGEDGERQLRLVAEAMEAAGASVNSSTGFHVHHDMAPLNCRAITMGIQSYYNSQRAIDNLVARSRRGSQYARPLTPTDIRQIAGVSSTSRLREVARLVNRFKTINVNAYAKFGTVEIRQHQGTLNAKKMIAWVRFGQAIFNCAAQNVALAHSDANALVTQLEEQGNLDADTATYLRTRARHFQAATVRV